MKRSGNRYRTMRNSLRARLQVGLLLVLMVVFGNLSREWVHSFAGHEDTIHHYHGEGLYFEGEHHHCDFLEIPLPVFVTYPPPAVPEVPCTLIESLFFCEAGQYISPFPFCYQLRGPPSA